MTQAAQTIDTIGAWGQVGLAGAIVAVVLGAVAFILREIQKMKGAVAASQRIIQAIPEQPPPRQRVNSDPDGTGQHTLDPLSVVLAKLEALEKRLDKQDAGHAELDRKVDTLSTRQAGIAEGMKWLRRAVANGDAPSDRWTDPPDATLDVTQRKRRK
jgi:hypothetical protein